MKKLIMFVMVLAIAAPAGALVYPDIAPDFTGCENSAWVVWELLTDDCLPSSDTFNPPYAYNPEPVDEPTFGSRHYTVNGWGSDEDYEVGAPWEWSSNGGTGVYDILSEDSFNQTIPQSGGKRFLRQYFQVVHTMPQYPDTSLIGIGLEVWDMSIYEEDGWTGCPVGYEQLPGDGYNGGNEFPEPIYSQPLGGGWYQSIWITDFYDWEGDSIDDLDTKFKGQNVTIPAVEVGIVEATHTTCIVGMDTDYETGDSFEIEEVILDFIWFDEEDRSDIPDKSCQPRVGGDPPIFIDSNDIPIYEPRDAGGPPQEGLPTAGQILINLAWRPSPPDKSYPPFNVVVRVDPDPNVDHVASADYTFPDSSEPNQNVRLVFNETNYKTPQQVRVVATSDLLPEGDEAFNAEITIIDINIADPNFGYDPCSPGVGVDPCEGERIIQRFGIAVADNDMPHISVNPYNNFLDYLSENNPGGKRCVDVTLSHVPSDDVYLLIAQEGIALLIDSMTSMDPNFQEWTDPNRMKFTPGSYNVPQQICITAVDDPCRVEEVEAGGWVTGEIYLTPYSKDLKYTVGWIKADDYGFPVEVEDSGGTGEEKVIYFNAQDNECGAWGYDNADLNEDCVVDLQEMAVLYRQWNLCTDPYDAGYNQWGDCDKFWNLELRGSDPEEE